MKFTVKVTPEIQLQMESDYSEELQELGMQGEGEVIKEDVADTQSEVEGSQVNMKNQEKKTVIKPATHDRIGGRTEEKKKREKKDQHRLKQLKLNNRNRCKSDIV